jgi:NhaP-type Na+/H+ or K+/H+ antiporter
MSAGNLYFTGAVFAVFFIIIIYIILGSFLEKKNSPLFHETGIAIIIGFLLSLTFYLKENEQYLNMFAFNNEIFFYVLLPPIIFASGFNMRRKRFFDNLGYILLFGVVGTIVSFAIFSLLTILMMDGDFLTYYNQS